MRRAAIPACPEEILTPDIGLRCLFFHLCAQKKVRPPRLRRFIQAVQAA
ncbi:hypothetical protein AmDm5_1127 [Acetobacter malorum]|nr:hypothetical protein AmDm5_1127 [Acetobacter malorum]